MTTKTHLPGRQAFVAVVLGCLVTLVASSCTSLGGGAAGDGERGEKRVAYLQNTLDPIPLVMSWPVTPVPEKVTGICIDGDLVYSQGAKNSIYASTLSDGMLQWAYRGFDAPLDLQPVHNSYASVLVSQGDMVAIEHLTGRPMWVRRLEIATTSEPAISESHLYVGSHSRNLQAYNLADGRGDWFRRVRRSYVTAAPVVHEPRVFFAAENGNVYSIDGASGDSGASEGILHTAKDAIVADLYVHGDHVYVASQDHNLYCIDRLSGKIVWTFIALTPLSTGALSGGGLVYVRSADGVMHAIDEMTGEERWMVPDVERFVAAVAGDSYLLRGKRTLLRIDIATGEEMGRVRLDAWDYIPSNPEGDQLVLGTRDGYVFALEELRIR